MTTAKGLTSGYAPMGAVLISDAVYQVLAGGAEGNTRPLGARADVLGASGQRGGGAGGAAALYRGRGCWRTGSGWATLLQAELRSRFAGHPLVGDVRGARHAGGAWSWWPTRPAKTPIDPALGIGDALTRIGYDAGLVFRGFADGTIGLAPPLCCTEHDMGLLLDRLGSTLDQALRLPGLRGALAA